MWQENIRVLRHCSSAIVLWHTMLWSFAQSGATTFFDIFQNTYAFFSASAHRWKIVVSVTLSDSEMTEILCRVGRLNSIYALIHSMLTPTVKSLSQTRWSESADAAKALRLVHSRFKKRLDAYTILHEIFDLIPASIRESSNCLVEAYPEHRKMWNMIWRMNLCSCAASPAATVVSSKGMRKLALSFTCTAVLPHHSAIITGGRSSTSVNGDIAIQWEWSNFDHS